MEPLAIQPAAPTFPVAISATFTAEPLAAAIRFWSKQLSVNFETRFAPYNQPLQTLLDPAGLFAANQTGANILLFRVEDLGQFDPSDRETHPRLLDNLRQLLAAILAVSSRTPAPLIVVLCPPSARFAEESASSALMLEAADRCASELSSAKNVHLLSPADLHAQYPVDEIHDAEGDRLGRVPYTTAWFASCATAIVRRVHALSHPPYKVIAVDCDNTLWDGICGEDGPDGVSLDPPRRFLQEFLLAQREAGVLLCMVSKNNEADVLETFGAHPDWPLRPDHFASWRINWDPKPENLASLAEELSLGLDSFIFLDDNPKECAEVHESLPEVLSLALPVRIGETPAFLRNVWAFDHPVITDEDRKRSESYAQVREFNHAVQSATSLDSFIESLGLALNIASATSSTLPRVAQLTQRTNQFNTTTIRRSEADLQALLSSGSHSIFTATVTDRFGDYGLTGVLIAEQREQELRLDSFLLSCRILGRGVEHKMLAFAGRYAFDHELEFVSIAYTPTAKNLPAKRFLDSLKAETAAAGDATIYRMHASALLNLQWRPEKEASPARAAEVRKPKPTRAPVDYGAIAARLNSAGAVLSAMKGESLAGFKATGQEGQPITESELRLARIWAELLHVSSIRVSDNFFDLGGHSLLAVLLLMRIREEFGVELSVDEVYTGGLTLASLARTIEARQMGEVSAEEYEALLAEIERLSDDEVRALLEQESQGEAAN